MNSVETIKQEEAQKPELRGYKTVCAKLGLSMCAYFIFRFLATLASAGLSSISDNINESLLGLLNYFIVIIMVYIIPLIFTVVIFKYKTPLRVLYKKPRRVVRYLGTFPAAYGLGYGVALLTLLATFLLSKIFGGETYIEQILRPTTVEATTNITELIMMMILLVVVAPIFEEYWVRGVMFDALAPYGAGIAILLSSLLFGLMHGTLYMLFYTFAFGLALGYIRYASGSLFVVTILHALVNSVSATILFLQSLSDITKGQNRVLNTVEMIYIVIVLVLVLVGVIAFFARIPKMRKYKFENPWTEIGPWKKIGIFAVSIPIIIMAVLAFNELSGFLLFDLLR